MEGSIRTSEWFQVVRVFYRSTGGLPEPPGGFNGPLWALREKGEREGRGRAPLPLLVRIGQGKGGGAPPPFLSHGRGKGRRRGRGKGWSRPLPRPIQTAVGGHPLRPSSLSTKAHIGPILPWGVSVTPRYSDKYRNHWETIPVSEYHRPIY